VAVRVTPRTVSLHLVQPDPDGSTLLAEHPRAAEHGQWVLDPDHYQGLPDGHTRAVTLDPPPLPGGTAPPSEQEMDPMQMLRERRPQAAIPAGRRDLDTYTRLTEGGIR
jgi:hypothetical protein